MTSKHQSGRRGSHCHAVCLLFHCSRYEAFSSHVGCPKAAAPKPSLTYGSWQLHIKRYHPISRSKRSRSMGFGGLLFSSSRILTRSEWPCLTQCITSFWVSQLQVSRYTKVALLTCGRIGVVKTQWYEVWIKQERALRETTEGGTKRELHDVHSLLWTVSGHLYSSWMFWGLIFFGDKAEFPAWLGRIPSQIGIPAGGSLSADEWKTLALVFGPLAVWNQFVTNVLASIESDLLSGLASGRVG